MCCFTEDHNVFEKFDPNYIIYSMSYINIFWDNGLIDSVIIIAMVELIAISM